MNSVPMVIVTGANRGIGRATVLELAARGHGVILGVRDPSSAASVMADLGGLGKTPFHLLQVDLSEPASIHRFVSEILKLNLNVCGLINNGGVCRLKEQVTSSGVEYTLAVNAFGAALLSQMVLDHGLFTGRGKIINVGSHILPRSLDRSRIEGQKAFSVRDAYMQSKLAMLLFALGVAGELPHDVCDVTTIFPGVVRSRLGRESFGTRLLGALFDPFIEPPSKGAKRIADLFERRGDAQGSIFNKDSLTTLTYEGDMDADIAWLKSYLRRRFRDCLVKSTALA